LLSENDTEYAWYHARFFEVISTLFMFFILLCDVFSLYRESKNKYLNSSQNSIRDPLTRLYNRSYFYDTLAAQLEKTSVSRPLSAIVECVRRADAAMYEAKKGERNRVVIWHK
jgi:PleD family two-component response regulator